MTHIDFHKLLEFQFMNWIESCWRVCTNSQLNLLQIDEFQNKHRDKELQMRGKKGQSIEEVEDLLWEYEDDITTRTQKLNELIVRPFS